ncbi:hypothetical protein B0J14DRAFT_659223 [Halenospora varia]|nr:hypothetical protein B0J14DRAFT_659223 [Halenospora varia]
MSIHNHEQRGEKLAGHRKRCARDRDRAGLEEVLSSASLKRARQSPAPTSLPPGKRRRLQPPPVSSPAQAMPEHWLLSTFFPHQYYKVARKWWRDSNGKTYKVDDFVEVYHVKNRHGKNDGKNYDNYDPRFSFGRIRRLRPGKVLVEYLYWPEELESGRQSYHSAWELIGSDHWQVVSVESLVRVVEVNYWDEEEEGEPPRGRFWRQTYITRTKELSNLKAHCLCDGPSNPDIPNFICDSHDCGMLHHKSCLEKEYRDLFEESAEILQEARVLRVKISRGVEEFSIFNVSCYQCGTTISLEDTIPEGSERDSLENTLTTNLDDEIHRTFNFADLLSLLSIHLLSRVEQRSLLSEILDMAKESSGGWEPKLLKTRYPWLEDNILKLLITLSDFLRNYSSQCEAAQKKPSIDNLLLSHIWLAP